MATGKAQTAVNLFADLPESVAKALSVLKTGGYGGWLVGGCVRDTLMGKQPHDYDITTPATPEELLRLFSGWKCIEAGLKHGTVTPVIAGVPVEITTFRIDGVYLDHRRPESVTFTADLAEDLSRRDFTVNAMAYSLTDGLADLFGGQTDLKARVIRCVGDPDMRFNEDGLRILRALRFASVLDFTVDPLTGDSVRRNAGLLKAVSAERIYAEFRRLVCGPGAGRVLAAYGDVLTVFLPGLGATVSDAGLWRQRCRALDAAPPEEWVRMAVLFSDMDRAGAEAAMRGMKTDALARRQVGLAVGLQGEPALTAPEALAVRRLCRRAGFGTVQMLAAAAAAKAVAAGDTAGAAAARTAARMAAALEADKVCCSLKQLAVTGTDLMAAGYPGGAGLGALLERLLDAVVEGQAENTRSDLLALAEALQPKRR